MSRLDEIAARDADREWLKRTVAEAYHGDDLTAPHTFDQCGDPFCADAKERLGSLLATLDAVDVDLLRSPRNSLGKLALPKGLMERAVEAAWDAPGVRTDIGDPSEGIVMTSLSELADAICDALAVLTEGSDRT